MSKELENDFFCLDLSYCTYFMIFYLLFFISFTEYLERLLLLLSFTFGLVLILFVKV
jgi:hypothetical protein